MNKTLKHINVMKQILVIFSVIALHCQLNAQSGLGFYFSVNQDMSDESSILLGDGSNYEYEFTSLGSQTGYTLGLFHGTNISNVFYLNKAIQVSKDSRTFQISNLTDAPFDESSVDRYTIQVPITAGIKIGALSIGVGPRLDIIASESRSQELSNTFRINQERVSWSGILESTYSFNKYLSLNFRLQQSFTGASSGYYYNEQPVKIDSRPTQWSAGVIITPF
jgi:hypothetical protein